MSTPCNKKTKRDDFESRQSEEDCSSFPIQNPIRQGQSWAVKELSTTLASLKSANTAVDEGVIVTIKDLFKTINTITENYTQQEIYHILDSFIDAASIMLMILDEKINSPIDAYDHFAIAVVARLIGIINTKVISKDRTWYSVMTHCRDCKTIIEMCALMIQHTNTMIGFYAIDLLVDHSDRNALVQILPQTIPQLLSEWNVPNTTQREPILVVFAKMLATLQNRIQYMVNHGYESKPLNEFNMQSEEDKMIVYCVTFEDFVKSGQNITNTEQYSSMDEIQRFHAKRIRFFERSRLYEVKICWIITKYIEKTKKNFSESDHIQALSVVVQLMILDFTTCSYLSDVYLQLMRPNPQLPDSQKMKEAKLVHMPIAQFLDVLVDYMKSTDILKTHDKTEHRDMKDDQECNVIEHHEYHKELCDVYLQTLWDIITPIHWMCDKECATLAMEKLFTVKHEAMSCYVYSMMMLSLHSANTTVGPSENEYYNILLRGLLERNEL